VRGETRLTQNFPDEIEAANSWQQNQVDQGGSNQTEENDQSHREFNFQNSEEHRTQRDTGKRRDKTGLELGMKESYKEDLANHFGPQRNTESSWTSKGHSICSGGPLQSEFGFLILNR